MQFRYSIMNQATPFRIRYEVYSEDGMFVARCLDLDVVSDGATDAEAVANLREAIMLHCERHAELKAERPEDDPALSGD